jgi:hypothetical protein
MKHFVRYLVLVTCLTVSLAAMSTHDALRTRNTAEPNQPRAVAEHTATIYISGYVEGSGSGAYWMKWGDFAGELEAGREEGVVKDYPSKHRLDLSAALADGSDTLEVWVGKSEAWEGYLNLVVKLDGKFVGCDDTRRAIPPSPRRTCRPYWVQDCSREVKSVGHTCGIPDQGGGKPACDRRLGRTGAIEYSTVGAVGLEPTLLLRIRILSPRNRVLTS